MKRSALVTAAALLILALAPLALPFLQFVLTIAIAKGFAALGVALLLRAGLISLGHAMFYAIGAYAAAFMATTLGITDFALLIIGSTAISAFFGVLFGLFLVRYRAIFFAMLNLAVSMVIYALASKLYGITGGTDGLRVAVPTVFGMTLEKSSFDGLLYYTAIVLVALLGYLVHRYLKSPLGHALSAVHSNEVRLEYLGVSAWSTLLTAYGISAALAGVGGAIAALSIGHVLPEFAFWTESGHLVLTAVLGGIAGIAGPFLGSVFLEIVHTVAVGYAAEAWNMIVGIALLVVIFFLPRGLFGLFERLVGRKSTDGEPTL
ncbi:branched-chain amino acid ABC transporter permease [Pseudodonghicola flavimaris]|uniref:Branched-chain amino acid ABC transporter permease n=1 Tax=Pseudodonghicola flavimaris TaxID=3050036 RepID=A0ABT7F2P9_9RHOB|nr:branched-chain amino acid ABC transporter permease [Pseudodonghicola flavimaris]MDK3018855.1 branched-chain amino acid ABC transporter permease [Pseudodonghicola flavimaris]